MQEPGLAELLASARQRLRLIQQNRDVFRRLEHRFVKQPADRPSLLAPELISASDALDRGGADGASLSLFVLGANSAGKSTFLNTLLGLPALPTGSGHVTGRICRLGWCKPEDAQISFLRVEPPAAGRSTGTFTVLPIRPVPLCYPRVSPEETKKRAVMDINEALSRANAPSGDRLAYAQWLSTVVDVRFPFPGLYPGLELYDPPGVSSTDDPEVQKMLSTFLGVIRPMIMFLYANASFSDAEYATLELLLGILGNTRDPSHASKEHRIFFLHTRFDRDDIMALLEGEFDPEEGPPSDALIAKATADEREKRFRHIKEALSKPERNQQNLLAALEEKACFNWAAASSLHGPNQGRAPWVEFLRKLDHFASISIREQLVTATEALLSGVQQFFQQVTLRYYNVRPPFHQILQELKSIDEGIKRRVAVARRLFCTRLQSVFKSEETRLAAVGFARKFKGPFPAGSKDADKAAVFIKAFCDWVDKTIFEREWGLLRHRLSTSIIDEVEAYMATPVLFGGSLKMVVDYCLLFDNAIPSLHVLLRDHKAASLTRDISYGEQWRLQEVQMQLISVRNIVGSRTFSDAMDLRLTTPSEILAQPLQQEIRARVELYNRAVQYYPTPWPDRDEARLQFGLLAAELLAFRSSLLPGGDTTPVFPQNELPLFGNSAAEVRRGNWCGKSVLISTVARTADASGRRLFCEEIQLAWIATHVDGARVASMLPLVGVFRARSGEYQAVYEQPHGAQTLETRLNRPVSAALAWHLMESLCEGLEAVHESSLYLRCLTLRTVFLVGSDEQPQVLFAPLVAGLGLSGERPIGGVAGDVSQLGQLLGRLLDGCPAKGDEQRAQAKLREAVMAASEPGGKQLSPAEIKHMITRCRPAQLPARAVALQHRLYDREHKMNVSIIATQPGDKFARLRELCAEKLGIRQQELPKFFLSKDASEVPDGKEVVTSFTIAREAQRCMLSQRPSTNRKFNNFVCYQCLQESLKEERWVCIGGCADYQICSDCYRAEGSAEHRERHKFDNKKIEMSLLAAMN